LPDFRKGNKVKFFIILFLFVILTSCSTAYKEPVVLMDQAYLNCETLHSEFIDVFDCIKSDESTKNLKTDEVDLLFLKGEQLKEQINQGKLSSIDAKFEWKKLIFDIKQQLSELRYRRMYDSMCRVNYRGYCRRW
jgi:hypothetical protein